MTVDRTPQADPTADLAIAREALEAIAHMAAGWMVGWDEADTDPAYVGMREAWTTAGQRLLAALDRMKETP
jgi:hypothetical protein